MNTWMNEAESIEAAVNDAIGRSLNNEGERQVIRVSTESLRELAVQAAQQSASEDDIATSLADGVDGRHPYTDIRCDAWAVRVLQEQAV